MEQDAAGSLNKKNKRPIGCFGWGVIIIAGLWAIGTIFPSSGDSASPAPSSTQGASPSLAPVAPANRTSGCNTISSSIYTVAQKLAGIGSTYTIADVAPVLLESGEKWATWVEINNIDGNPKSAEWLDEMSTAALKLRVALLDENAEAVTANGELLKSAIDKTSSFCPQ